MGEGSFYVHGTDPQEQKRLTTLNDMMNQASVSELRLDAKERGSRSRYPLIGSATKPADEGHLVGYVCAAPLRNAIADTRLADIIASAPVPVDVIADAADPPFAAAAREFRLPENVAHWHGGSVEWFTEQSGLPDARVYSIALDGNKVYVGTAAGIAAS